MTRVSSGFVFVHSSDEMYGADRMVVEMLDALPEVVRESAQVWLPTDLPHAANPLCQTLEARGITVRHEALPILRRSLRSPNAIARLSGPIANSVRILRQARPNTVYCTTSATFLMAPLARAVGVPRVIGHVQEIWSPGTRRVLTPLALANHRLVCISHAVEASLPNSLRSRTRVVLNATPTPSETSPLAASGPLRFLVASRWNGWKGHRTLLSAWDLLDAPGKLLVLGGPPPSGTSVDVPTLVTQLRLPETVELVGEVIDPATFIQRADVVVVPSDKPEPFGLVAIEAFAHGRPVLGSAAGGLAEIVADGRTGWLFPPGDHRALAEILASLTRDQVRAAGAAARREYESHYTPEKFQTRWRQAVL